MSVNDIEAIRNLAYLYAQGMDSNRPDLLEIIFADDVVIDAPGHLLEGKAVNLNSPAILKQMYFLTQHVVHNQTVTINGDEAEGETYCTANHVTRTGPGKGTVLAWGMRYLNRYRREGGAWRFTHRKLIVDWTETRPVDLPQG
jgi:hypothetical protein